MPTKIIREPGHVDALAAILRGRKLPVTVSWAQGAARSSAQNRLAHRWFADVARQFGDQTAEDVRAECKLRFGVPILRAESEAFRLSYDRTMRHLPYEAQIEAIKAFDLPVTRLMTVQQMSAFINAVQHAYARQGVRLTDPEAMKYEEEFGPAEGVQ